MRSKNQLSRSVRLTRIQHYLFGNPSGVTASELANICQVGIRTIQRDLFSLETDLRIPILKKAFDRYTIIEGYILPPVSFSLYEALVIFLAARLVMRQSDENNAHINSALTKISSLLPEGLCESLLKSLKTSRAKLDKPEYLDIYEKLAIAWATKRKLAITYSSLRSGETNDWLLKPYYVEMTGIGCSTYVIGQAVKTGFEGLYTFKLDRIKSAKLLEESFEIPPDFDLDKLLAGAWGIVWGEEIEVKLKFTAKVCRRLKETQWHASQVITDLPDGGCVMTLKVGSTLELTPWIRSWGPDVEVIEPSTLKDEFKKWADQLNKIYNKNL